MRALSAAAPPMPRPAWDRTANEVLYGRQDDGPSGLGVPTGHHMVSVGGPGVHARSTPQRQQTTAEIIADMIARNR